MKLEKQEMERKKTLGDSLHHVQCVSDLQISTHICAPTIVVLAPGKQAWKKV